MSHEFYSNITDIDLFKQMQEFIALFEKAIYQHSMDVYSGKKIHHYDRPCDALFQQIAVFLAALDQGANTPQAKLVPRLMRCFEKFDLNLQAKAAIKRFVENIKKILHSSTWDPEQGGGTRNPVSLVRDMFYYTYEYMPHLDESIAADDLSKLLLELPGALNVLGVNVRGCLSMQRILQDYSSGRISAKANFLLDGSIKQYITHLKWILGFSDKTIQVINRILENINIDLNDTGIFLHGIISFKVIENTLNKDNQWYLDEVKLFIEDIYTKKIDAETMSLLRKLEHEAVSEENPEEAVEKTAAALSAATKDAAPKAKSSKAKSLTKEVRKSEFPPDANIANTNTIQISKARRQQLFLLLKAYAEQKSTYAQARLSMMYFENEGILSIEYSGITEAPKKLLYRLEQAFQWAKIAALSEHSAAAINLANFYEYDYGIPAGEYSAIDFGKMDSAIVSLIDSGKGPSDSEIALYRKQQIFKWRLFAAEGLYPDVRFQVSKYYADNFAGISTTEKLQRGTTEKRWQEYCLNQAYYWCRKSDNLGYVPARQQLPIYLEQLKNSYPQIIISTAKQALELATSFLDLKDFLSFARSCKSALTLARGNASYWQSILQNEDRGNYFYISEKILKSKDYLKVVRSLANRLIRALHWKKSDDIIASIIKKPRLTKEQRRLAISDVYNQIIDCPLCGSEDKPKNHDARHTRQFCGHGGWEHMACNNCIEHKLWTLKEGIVLWGFSYEQLCEIPHWGSKFYPIYCSSDLIEFFKIEAIHERSFTGAVDIESYKDIINRQRDLPAEVREIITIRTKPCFKSQRSEREAKEDKELSRQPDVQHLVSYRSLRKMLDLDMRKRENIVRFGSIIPRPSAPKDTVADADDIDHTQIEVTLQHKFKPGRKSKAEPAHQSAHQSAHQKGKAYPDPLQVKAEPEHHKTEFHSLFDIYHSQSNDAARICSTQSEKTTKFVKFV